MLLLLAQLVAPPVQNSPVRLPAPDAPEQRPAPDASPSQPPVEIEAAPDPGLPPGGPGSATPGPPDAGTVRPGDDLPAVSGLSLYGAAELRRILAGCGADVSDREQRLKACAATLTARLVADGYVNSRAYAEPDPAPGRLVVVEGVLAELRVEADDPRLERRVRRWLLPLQGQVLHLPAIETQLQLLKRQRGITAVRGRLSRLGTDSSQAVFSVAVSGGAAPWQGDFSLRNDGTNDSGDLRAVGTLLKPDLLLPGDALLLYGEASGTSEPQFGSVISSISYTLPLAERLSLTGAFGFSRRNLIELDSPGDRLSVNQYQGLGQIDWTFHESLRQRWNLFLGLSGNRSQTFFAGRRLDTDFVPESIAEPRSAYLRFGVSGSGLSGPVAWGGNLYALQGLAAATPSRQRRELDAVGIEPGKASAIGSFLAGSWRFAPRWQLLLQAAGQVALRPLTSPMQFTLGSDVGLRGLPGQLVSGDSGWLTSGELSWTFWQRGSQALQLVPFIGAGGVRTVLDDVSFSDTVGSGGILLRWLESDTWAVELGWAEQFSTDDNDGVWQDRLLGSGLYARVNYRF